MQPGFERVVAAQPAARRSSVAQTVAMAAAVLALVGVVAHTVSWCAERPGVRWGRAGAGCTPGQAGQHGGRLRMQTVCVVAWLPAGYLPSGACPGSPSPWSQDGRRVANAD